MKRVLLDTDIILDVFFDRKPFADAAARILSLCESKAINGFVTSVILSNLYYLLRRNSTHKKVVDKLKLLVTITDVLLTTKGEIIQALNSEFRDFEDATQNYSAIASNSIDAIITRNINDYKNSKLAVFTPEIYLKTLKLN